MGEIQKYNSWGRVCWNKVHICSPQWYILDRGEGWGEGGWWVKGWTYLKWLSTVYTTVGVKFPPLQWPCFNGNDFNNMSLVQYSISRQTFLSTHREGETENCFIIGGEGGRGSLWGNNNMYICVCGGATGVPHTSWAWEDLDQITEISLHFPSRHLPFSE